MDTVTDNANMRAELSFQATSQLTTNNAQDIVSAVGNFCNLLTSGMYSGAVHLLDAGLDVSVGPGQTIYLNTDASSASIFTKCIIRVEER